jgi:predicted metal-binding membrane protein
MSTDVEPRRRAARPVDRRALAGWVGLAAFVAVAWWLLIARSSHAHGLGDRVTFGTALGAWLVMTAAMMLPTTVPVLRALADILRSGSERGAASGRWWTFLGGYVAVWSSFAVVAATVQVLAADRVPPEADRVIAVIVLAIAGAYQFTSLKQRCLTECVSPMTFFMRHWRDGTVGAAHMGVRHAAACVGCCWALMSLAFVGGMNSLPAMVALTMLMVVEKLPALDRRVARPLGVVLLAAAAWVAVAGLPSSDSTHRHHHGASSARVLDPAGVPTSHGGAR